MFEEFFASRLYLWLLGVCMFIALIRSFIPFTYATFSLYMCFVVCFFTSLCCFLQHLGLFCLFFVCVFGKFAVCMRCRKPVCLPYRNTKNERFFCVFVVFFFVSASTIRKRTCTHEKQKRINKWEKFVSGYMHESVLELFLDDQSHGSLNLFLLYVFEAVSRISNYKQR